MNRVRFSVFALSLSTALAALSAGAMAAPAGKCDLESIRAMTPKPGEVDSVKYVDAPVGHCEVLGHNITENPGPNRVEWSVLLPDNFHGRYYVIGQGAGAGNVFVANNSNILKLLNTGFAFSSSDTGHKGSMWDFGANNPAGRLDYGHRGAHVSLVATKALTKAYYGMKDKLYSYHLGCSGGGRMGMMAALHHPEDFDGIVASTVAKGGGSLEFGPIMQHVVNNPKAWISPAKLAFLEKKVNDKCAGPDGLVRDPYGCKFDVMALQCKGADGPDCLTPAEISTFKVITGRFKLGNDEDSDVPGFSISNPTGWSSFLIGNTPPTSKSRENPWAPEKPPSSYGIMQSIARGMYFDDLKFDVINDVDFKAKEVLNRLTERHPVWAVTTPDLSAYKKAGGKLIMWEGLAENAVPPATEVEYYEAMKKAVPGTEDFVRLYNVPGVHHCGGGPGPQDTADRLLDKVIEWVEDGTKPEAVIASTATPFQLPAPPGSPPRPLTAPSSSRMVLLCPYPQIATFAGKPGSFPYDAAKWKCQ